ncbi:MAG: hypothetical protein WBO68_10320 [Pyrinomonadaceae bacterium]
MFEQSLYEQEPIQQPQADAAVEPVQEGDLFSTYEIKSWSPSPRLYKILGASAAVNLLALLVFAQTSVLTMKGCDSPLVGSVCQVLDTVYVGAMLFGTEREFADVAYEKTEIDNATLVFTELPPESEKLRYPSDYFQIANPVQYQAMLDQQNGVGLEPGYLAPGIPAGIPPNSPYKPGGSIFDTQPNIPKRNNNVTDLSKLPKDLDDNDVAGTGPTTKVKKPKVTTENPEANKLNPDGTVKGFPGMKPTTDPNTQAATDPQDEAKPDQFGIFINKRPIKDKAKDTVAKVEANEVKLDTAFKISVTGTLGIGKDGKTIILKNAKEQQAPGVKNDPKMSKLVREWIAAVGDAGWYAYALTKEDREELAKKKPKERKVIISIEQNDAEFLASIRTEQADENIAKTLSSGLNGTFGIAGMTADEEIVKFLKAASSTAEGNAVILSVRMPTPQVQDMIKKKLAEQKTEPNQPNGNAIVRPGDNTAKR